MSAYTQALVSRIRGLPLAELLAPDQNAKHLRRDWYTGHSYHEAGHAIALLAAGVLVGELVIDGEGGSCAYPRDSDPAAVLLAVAAGCESARMAGVASTLSDDDWAAFRAAVAKAGLSATPPGLERFREHYLDLAATRLLQHYRDLARRFLADHWEEVSCLAHRLAEWGKLGPAAIANFCREQPVLRKYADLYRFAALRPMKDAVFLKEMLRQDRLETERGDQVGNVTPAAVTHSPARTVRAAGSIF